MDDRQVATSASLTFLGAAGTVTGSRFLVELGWQRALVDCGLFQGVKQQRLRNWDPFPVPPDLIGGVLITHAHLDHVGYLPALVRQGLRCPVFVTPGTAALAAIVLPDSGRLQEEQARHAVRHGYSRHRPPRPLYTEADARRALLTLAVRDVGDTIQLGGRLSAVLHEAGHILGAAQVELSIRAGPTAWFTGDLGRPTHPLLPGPAELGACDALIVESTYGNRRHGPAEEGLERLAQLIERTEARGGVTIIPAFAVDRTELLLLALGELQQQGRLTDVPVFVDSPMALAALDVYREALRNRQQRPDEQSDPLGGVRASELRTPEQSKSFHSRRRGVLISASGMATGGRVLHHLERRLPDARNSVALVGYQADGTRGRALLDGARQVKIHGRYIPVRAEVVAIPGFSAHADRDELLEWLSRAPRPPGVVYVVHGEAAASASLRDAIDHKLGWNAVVPRHGERVRLG